MKKLYLSMMLLVLPILASAYDAEVDGIYYNLNPSIKEAYVTYQDYFSGIEDRYYSDYSGSVIIPEKIVYDGVEYTVTRIGENAFRGCNDLISVTIPKSVSYIEDKAFLYCNNLISVTIPKSVKSIGEYAFFDCGGLISIRVESGNSKYDSRNDCNAIIETEMNMLVVGCMNTVIPNSVTSIGVNAFRNCSGLTSITIPNSVTSIGRSAFYGCSSLTSITIPNSVTSIGKDAFDGCSGLKSLEFHCKDIQSWFDFNKSIEKVIIGDEVERIGIGAFSGCSGLTSVHITDLDEWCNIDFNDFDSNPLFYAHHLYLNDEEITKLVIPEGNTGIKSYTFSGFSGLTSVIIPNSVTSIGSNAFYGCSGLTSVVIGNSVKSINDRAFSGCVGMTSVTISSTVKNIEGNVFEECNNLSQVISKMDYPCTISSFCFTDNVFNNSTLYVPKGTIDRYKLKDFWNKFENIVEGEPSSSVEPGTTKCATPIISYSNKELTFSCETEGVDFKYTITDSDIKTDFASKVSLSATYEISVYAMKEGLGNSDVATATLVWTDAIFTVTTPETPTSAKEVKESIPVLISANGGVITVKSEQEGQAVAVYTADGKALGSATVKDGQAAISTNLQWGEIVIVKVGGRSVKVKTSDF